MKSNTVQILTTVLSNTAVLAGVVFLVIELKQNSAIALSQMTQERALSVLDQHTSYALDQEFSKLLARVYKHYDFESVTSDEWDQIVRYEMAKRTRSRDIWFQHTKGLIDEEIYSISINGAANNLPLWEWLKLFVPEDFMTDAKKRSESEDFRENLLRTKFLEWSKDKKSPYEI